MSSEDKQIALSGKPDPHPQEKRLEVARHIVKTGNTRIASELAGIPYATIAAWKRSDWWPSVLEEAKQEARAELQSRINVLAEASLDVMHDRLQNGEHILNMKTGELVRKPVGLRDANAAMNNLLTRSAEIERLREKSSVNGDSTNEILKTLATEFAKLTKKKQVDVVDVDYKEVE